MSAIKSIKSVIPMLDRVLVQRLKPKTQTASGIFIPEKNTEKLNEADVLAVGPGVPDTKTGALIEPAVKAGDRVLLPSFGGSVIKVGEDEYLLFRDTEILAKLSKD